MAKKRRPKRSRPCACGCGQDVKPSRINTGKSWRIYVESRYQVFNTTQCLVRAAAVQFAWRPALTAAMRPYSGGHGSRGVVAVAMEQIQAMSGAYSPTDGLPALDVEACFEAKGLTRYMDLLLLGCFEWYLRLGFQAPAAWHAQLLSTFPGRKQWLQQRRCTVWALLDTTAVFLIAHYIRQLEPDLALLSIVVATICHNNWKVLMSLFGATGVPRATALEVALRQAQARERNLVNLAPVGGLTGSGRLTLGAFAAKLGLQRSSGNNTEHFHVFVGQLYMEHCSGVVADAWRSLVAIAHSSDSQGLKNEATLELLRREFHLYGLCQEHVARLVGVL